MVLVSACLAGFNCRYDGGNSSIEEIKRLLSKNKAIPICPEQLGGLKTPRKVAEILGGDGYKVLEGKAKVIDIEGVDLSRYFILGAEKVLRIAKILNIKEAIFKDKSPSCGVNLIYDGNFNNCLKKGVGVTTALLRLKYIEVKGI
jgi:uncharacterized protein YbbK (DUF523 family)